MKVGILTLVNQLNYGGVLQAYALQTALARFKVDVDVIDYWLSPGNSYLNGVYFSPSVSLWEKVVRLGKAFLKSRGVPDDFIRIWRTRRFLREHLKMSSLEYRTPDDLRNITGYDCIVVGSDQVFNYKWHGSPNPFLLIGLDDKIRRVSYAASMGFESLPLQYRADYRSGLERFTAISVREAEGIRQISAWGVVKTVVKNLDPVLLLEKDSWNALLPEKEGDDYIFCYWLGDVTEVLCAALKSIGQTQGKRICFYSNKTTNVSTLLGGIKGIRFFHGAGPMEFLAGIANSSAVFSDSFHALMFGCVFEKPMRIIGGSSTGRKEMCARLTCFCSTYNLSNVYLEQIDLAELSSFDVDYSGFRIGVTHGRVAAYDYLSSAVRPI